MWIAAKCSDPVSQVSIKSSCPWTLKNPQTGFTEGALLRCSGLGERMGPDVFVAKEREGYWEQ